jgi:hypothetical protein
MIHERYRSNILLSVIYLSLLAVLLPATAWALARFEPPGNRSSGFAWGAIIAWVAAFALAGVRWYLASCFARFRLHISQHGRRRTLARIV